jgi:hypothetical protein
MSRATVLARKAAVESELAALERQLVLFEDSLLADSNGAHIARGWEAFSRAHQLRPGSVAVTPGDRLFSASSLTAPLPVGRTVPFGRPITQFTLPGASAAAAAPTPAPAASTGKK